MSGLDVGAEGGQDAPIELLTGYLTGEMDASHAPVPPSQISRLIIVGNSLAPYEAAVQPKEVTPTELRKVRPVLSFFTQVGLSIPFIEKVWKRSFHIF